MIAIPGYEKIFLSMALGAMLLSVNWTRRHPPPSLGNPQNAFRTAAYSSGALAVNPPADSDWEMPKSQTRGAEWIYETFTPPEIYYDSRSQKFSVTPPRGPTAENGAEVRAESVPAPSRPFRLQLVGFVGGEGSYLGTFVNLATTEHILARAGRNLPELAVTIRDFQVKRIRREPDDSMPTSELVATAVVRDERTGEDVILTNLERTYAQP